MAIVSKTVSKLTASATETIGKIRLRGKYGKLLRIRARNWASSAKAGAGTDTAIKIKLTDGNSNVVYLDASDRDYATAEVILLPTQDDTATGLGTLAVDATGAAATAGAGAPIVMRDPVTVAVANAGTATDYFECELVWEV
jgi:hypothetical protein